MATDSKLDEYLDGLGAPSRGLDLDDIGALKDVLPILAEGTLLHLNVFYRLANHLKKLWRVLETKKPDLCAKLLQSTSDPTITATYPTECFILECAFMIRHSPLAIFPYIFPRELTTKKQIPEVTFYESVFHCTPSSGHSVHSDAGVGIELLTLGSVKLDHIVFSEFENKAKFFASKGLQSWLKTIFKPRDSSLTRNTFEEDVQALGANCVVLQTSCSPTLKAALFQTPDLTLTKYVSSHLNPEECSYAEASAPDFNEVLRSHDVPIPSQRKVLLLWKVSMVDYINQDISDDEIESESEE